MKYILLKGASRKSPNDASCNTLDKRLLRWVDFCIPLMLVRMEKNNRIVLVVFWFLICFYLIYFYFL